MVGLQQAQAGLAPAGGLTRIVAAALVGATIEWYDFFLYGVVAGIVLNKLYFPVSDPLVSTLLAYATFALGFVARPLGGVIFGHFGDKIGRKSMLVVTLLLMGTATFLIGLLPSYAQIGVAAPILLLVLRIVQGIGLGGEWGGAVLLAFEYAPPERRGLYASIPQIGLALGLCLASGIVAILSFALSDAQFLAFGWRIAFLLSICLVLIGIYIRLNILETPEFEKVKNEKRAPAVPFLTMINEHTENVIAGMGARVVDGVIFNIFAVFSIGYLSTSLHVSHTTALLGVTIAAIVMCAAIPFFGWLSDIGGRTTALWHRLAAGRLFDFPGLLHLRQLHGQYDGDLAGDHHPFRHSLCRCLWAGGGALFRALPGAGALHGHLLRLSILGHLRQRTDADHCHRAAALFGRAESLAHLQLLRAVGRHQRALGAVDPQHGAP